MRSGQSGMLSVKATTTVGPLPLLLVAARLAILRRIDAHGHTDPMSLEEVQECGRDGSSALVDG
jgi:hypothetical protein